MKVSTLTCLGLASTATCEITCGISSGYDRGDKAYFFSGDGSLANFDACSSRCQSDSKCQSFAFGSSQCLLYATALDTNFRPQSNSPFLFYDRNCVNVKATSSFTTVLPPTTAPAAGAAATPTPASATPGSGGGNGGSNGNGGSGGDSSSSGESGSAPTAQAVSTTDGTNTALPGSGGAPGGQLGASKTASSGFSTATATGTGASGESGSSATGTSSSRSSSSTGSSSSSGSSGSGSRTSGAAAVTAAEGFRMLVLGSLCALAVLV